MKKQTIINTYLKKARNKMSKTNYLETKILEHIFSGIPYTAPSSFYAGLLTQAPSDSNITELTIGQYGYERKQITFGSPTDGYVKSTNDVDFGPSTGQAWGDIHGIAIFDAETSGNALYWALKYPPLSPALGSYIIFRANGIVVGEE